jgi:hypothetical protein
MAVTRLAKKKQLLISQLAEAVVIIRIIFNIPIAYVTCA